MSPRWGVAARMQLRLPSQSVFGTSKSPEVTLYVKGSFGRSIEFVPRIQRSKELAGAPYNRGLAVPYARNRRHSDFVGARG